MSYILTTNLAREAVGLVRPVIANLLGSELTGGRSNLHIVILDPETGDPIYEKSFGDRSTWCIPYDSIARSEAQIAYRTQMVVRTVRGDAPWLYESGDTRYVGGAVENQLVVAASGLQDHFDEMISWMVLSAIQALCRDYIAKVSSTELDYFA